MAEEKLDPVCGMKVTEENAACSYELNGKKYYFCADACRDAFVENPDRFIRNRS